ncbi:hypothetical protein [Haliangium ochraceum]|uniref:NADH dehydrogenase (Quinone) n=1 Tax=Haliangium ochraceum (strain DSM 14365 / JCM 11303 / SMP-2) TaxID=502025 RepID=D0LL17_HALO1|nr:hypothetical protein [Haliangium ochraceum]ACY16737.1 NADH dehydrogenase (quinone) [Haliangium ochraceum DSM 14365]
MFDHALWQQIAALPLPQIFGAIAWVLLFGALFGRKQPRLARLAAEEQLPVADNTGDTDVALAVYFGRTRSLALGALATLLGLAGTVIVGLERGPGVLMLVVAAVLLAFCSITVRAGRDGLRVGFGPLSWPRVNIPLASIERAEVIDLRPLQWGGWGYRRRPHGEAVVVRAGEAVRLQLDDDSVFAVTAEHASEIAALLDRLIAERERDRGDG